MLVHLKKLGKLVQRTFIATIAILLAFIAFNIYQILAQSNQDIIDQDNKNFTREYSYFLDKSSQYSINDVLANKFTAINSKQSHIPYQLGKQTYWLKMSFTNQSNERKDLVLHADNTMLNVLDIYPYSNNQLRDKVFSLAIAKNRSPIATLASAQAFPHLSFELAKNESKQFLIRLQTLGPPNVPFVLYEQSNFIKRVQMTELLFGASVGIILLMAIYNFVLYFAIKDKVYLAYIGYLLSAFAALASVNGFGYFLFTNDVQQWLNEHSILFHFFLALFLLLFTLFFLRYDIANNKTYKIGISFCVLIFIIGLVSQFFDQVLQAKIFFSLQPVVYIGALFIIFRRLSKDFSWARFYFLSWIPLLIGAAIQPLMLLNYLDYSFYARHAFLLGALVEIIFMAFALAERMRRHEQDRLNEIGYHKATQLPRKLTLENTIEDLITHHTQKFSVLLIKPEQIDRIALYINNDTNIRLFKILSAELKPLFAYNDAIVPLTNNQEKICFIEDNSLAILLNHKHNHQPIQVVVDSIQQIISENFHIDELTLPLSGIIGIANYPEHGETANLLVNRAQLALKEAESNQQKWAYYNGELAENQPHAIKLAADIKAALSNHQFELYHQPQIDLKTLRVCGSECLIRWPHQDGFIRPSIFIKVAEDLGFINQITLWVLQQALTQHLAIVESGHKNHMISINISKKDIANRLFYDQVTEIIGQFDIKPEKIIFEVKESASTAINEQEIEVLEKLSDLGITISIDDFGTGNSSMSYISRLPFNELKVDGQFVENVCDSVKRRTICETTVKMAKGLALEVVAEGISSELDERTLRQFGCDIGQGHYYAEAMPIDEYLTWLDEQTNGQSKNVAQGVFIPADNANDNK
ncbi:EAL domain-containing protein [Colwelliaceae bacterium 6471]